MSMTADKIFQKRWEHHQDELRWLYMEMYDDEIHFQELAQQLEEYYALRDPELKTIDQKREETSDWYKQNDLLGMMLYVDNFAGNLRGVEEKLPYLQESGANLIHLMPFLDTVKGRSDGGYAVADFRKVRPDLGTMEDLEHLARTAHEADMNLCMDFVMNHTSEDHAWAKKARAGEKEYRDRYFFYDTDEIPKQFDYTVPQVFPTTAPGNFTWLEEEKQYVMTTFHPYQWDLNYGNPVVFNEMMYNFLYLCNRGIDVIRVDAVPYIWKQLGTNCRNQPKVHTIVRMMRIIGEIVCPGVLLLGEVVMEPERVVPYFGTPEKPECHMLYNVTTMATIWHTVATRDVRLLKKQLDIINGLPKEYLFLNYLRCHDDIGWGLSYNDLRQYGMEENRHKKYLNDYFLGIDGASRSRGALYNADPVTGDARLCGTTASLTGIEGALEAGDEEQVKESTRHDLMLHAFMFMLSGIPILYSGDEIGQLNDYSYKEDPEKAADSRFIHRGLFPWEAADRRDQEGTLEYDLFQGLAKLEQLRREEKAFVSQAGVWTMDTWDDSVLAVGRYYEDSKVLGLFNFSEQDRIAWIKETDGEYIDMMTGEERPANGVGIPGHGFYWLKRR